MISLFYLGTSLLASISSIVVLSLALLLYGWLALRASKKSQFKPQAFTIVDAIAASILGLWLISVVIGSFGKDQLITLPIILANCILYFCKYLSFCPSVCLPLFKSVFLSVSPSFCLPVFLSVWLFIRLSFRQVCLICIYNGSFLYQIQRHLLLSEVFPASCYFVGGQCGADPPHLPGRIEGGETKSPQGRQQFRLHSHLQVGISGVPKTVSLSYKKVNSLWDKT